MSAEFLWFSLHPLGGFHNQVGNLGGILTCTKDSHLGNQAAWISLVRKIVCKLEIKNSDFFNNFKLRATKFVYEPLAASKKC